MQITLQNISKQFNGKPVIHNISMVIRDHSFTTLLGPSGCGKTTLLRMISGLETPDKGEIVLGNTCVFSDNRHIFVPPEKRGLSYVFQDFALWPHMTVKENVSFGLKATGKTDQLEDDTEEALRLAAVG